MARRLTAKVQGKKLYNLLVLAVGMLSFIGCANPKLSSTPPNVPGISVKIQNYCAKSGYTYKDHFLYNMNASFNGSSWEVDSDGDGLPDSFEQDSTHFAFFGTSYLFADTLGNNYSDMFKVRLNLNAFQQTSMPTCASSGVDTDGDGLPDCEEAMLGTDRTQADHDLDGIPDGAEVRFGMNPLDANDAYTSPVGDGLSNLQKAKFGVMANVYLAGDALSRMPVYKVEANGTAGCYTLNISNIPIVASKRGNSIHVVAMEDSNAPPTGGTHAVGREARTLDVAVPMTIAPGSIVLINDGIHGQSVGGNSGNPIVIVGAGS